MLSVVLVALVCTVIHTPVYADVLVAGDDNIPDTADFVIIGGGTAGCVLASRLCTDLPQAKIVLLERGHPRNQAEEFTVTAPILNTQLYGNAAPDIVDVFRYFSTQPNPSLVDQETGQPGRKIQLIDAATLGGASNAATKWSYPLEGTVDKWGIKGLTSSKANDIFERVARVIKPAQPPPDLRQDYTKEALEAFSKFNYTIKDKQVPGEGGFNAELNFLTIDQHGRKRSSYVQYLLPVLNFVCKDSLTVIQDVTVTKLAPSASADKNKKISIVEYVSSSHPDLLHPKTIEAHEEILLSAGPYGSPKLLLLSGIGPKESIKTKGVDPILADLPVGKRTQLRPLVLGGVGRYSGRPLANVANTSLLTEKAAREFRAGNGGAFGLANSAVLGKRDDLGYHSSTWNLLTSLDEPYFSSYCFLNPVGFGNFTISDSGDPFANGIVYSDLLSDPEDYERALQCIKDFRKIIQGGFSDNFRMVDTTLNGSMSIQAWVAESTVTSWHYVGANAVGSVVDGDFKLLGGLKGIRIIDASVIPTLPVSAGPLSSVYMVAEFASEKLVKEYLPVFGPVNTSEPFMLVLSTVLVLVALSFTFFVLIFTRRQFFTVEEKEVDFFQIDDSVSNDESNKQTLDSSWTGHFEEKEIEACNSQNIPTTLLSWTEVTCSYPSSAASKSLSISLESSTGQLKSTQLTAVMGASGSGKSTLLDILSGHKTLGNMTGKMSLNGEVIQNIKAQAIDEASMLRSIAAYVPQQEVFFPTQTAFEAVAFVANLKLGKDPRGNHIRNSRIKSVLQEVGLSSDICKRPIGGELAGGVVIRGLSGGERKRLAVACALALKPRLLFLDEITSGLDSENALAITKLLKRLCSSRKVAAMMVIHQPDGMLFREFDQLILLSGGKTIFCDHTSKLPDLYKNVFKEDVPDWYNLPSNLLTQASNISSDVVNAMSNGQSKVLAQTQAYNLGHINHIDPPGTFWKFQTVFQRNLTNHYVRNFTNLTCRLIFYFITALIDGLLFWQVGDIEGKEDVGIEVGTVVGALTFIILASYLVPFAMIPIFVSDKKFFLAESALGLYSPWLYCLSQIILEAWVMVLAATIEAAVVVPMCGLWNPTMAKWETFFTFLGIMVVSGLTGSTLVLFHSMSLSSQDLAFLFGSGIVTIGLAVSGGFIVFQSMQGFISWMQWLSPCKYTLQALALAFFKGTPYESLVDEIYTFNNPPTVSQNVGVLIVFFVSLTVGTVIALGRQRGVR